VLRRAVFLLRQASTFERRHPAIALVVYGIAWVVLALITLSVSNPFDLAVNLALVSAGIAVVLRALLVSPWRFLYPHRTNNAAGDARSSRAPELERRHAGLALVLHGVAAALTALIVISRPTPFDFSSGPDFEGPRREARAVTPDGTHEVSLETYDCGERYDTDHPLHDDSSSPEVVRTLEPIDRPATFAPARALRDQIVVDYVDRGWRPIPRGALRKGSLIMSVDASAYEITVAITTGDLC
jgi:hypothetical protein